MLTGFLMKFIDEINDLDRVGAIYNNKRDQDDHGSTSNQRTIS
jgi:hypothetical protein